MQLWRIVNFSWLILVLTKKLWAAAQVAASRLSLWLNNVKTNNNNNNKWTSGLTNILTEEKKINLDTEETTKTIIFILNT